MLMSKIKKILLVLAFSLTSSLALAAESIVASVNGMVCIECQKKVIKSLKALSSGAEIKVLVSWPEGVAVSTFKEESNLSDDEYKNAILGTGFEVIKVVSVDKIITNAEEARKIVD